MARILFILVLALHCASGKEILQPMFLGSETNISVVVGRDASLTCVVEHLHNYKVAWLRVDTQTILTLGLHVITKNHRVAVSRADQMWTLNLKDTRPTDGGRYMCQINTEPMITQTHHLQVFVPPDILDASSGEVSAVEGDDASLHCAASGTPRPAIAWRREDLALMNIRGVDGPVSKWSGAWLNMSSVACHMNGAYFCIATNGVPPSVSKRILLHVFCKPSVQVYQKLIGGYLGHAVILQCTIEANPLSSVYWTHIDGDKLLNGTKYEASIKSQGYRHSAELRINNVSRSDVGAYHCHAENHLGSGRDDVNLYTLVTTASPATTTELITTETEITSLRVISSTESNILLDGDEKYSEEDSFVVVLSQHRMQNPDISASS